MLRAKVYFDLERPCILSELTDTYPEPFAVSQEEVIDDHIIKFLIVAGSRTDDLERDLAASEQVSNVERVDDERLVVTKRSCGALPIIRRNHGMLRGMDRVNGSQRVFDIVVYRREDLKHIVTDLDEIGTVHVGRLAPYEGARATLSPRQAEVIELALDAGYFEWPRDVDAEELAARLDISHVTFLEHLRKAQKKLLTGALESGAEAAVSPQERAFMLDEVETGV